MSPKKPDEDPAGNNERHEANYLEHWQGPYEWGPATYTYEEKKRIMAMVQSHERAQWMWSTIGIWARWITAVGGAVAAIKIGFADTIQRVIGR